MRVNRNHFGRQNESFEKEVDLPFLETSNSQSHRKSSTSFNGVFIRAPVVERLLTPMEGIQVEEEQRSDTIVAPSQPVATSAAARSYVGAPVEVLASLSVPRAQGVDRTAPSTDDDGDIIAVQQGNVFGTSFHPELAGDPRIHLWWLKQVQGILSHAMA